jgi:hypothetical protein
MRSSSGNEWHFAARASEVSLRFVEKVQTIAAAEVAFKSPIPPYFKKGDLPRAHVFSEIHSQRFSLMPTFFRTPVKMCESTSGEYARIRKTKHAHGALKLKL